jgi:serine/threonine protein kinase
MGAVYDAEGPGGAPAAVKLFSLAGAGWQDFDGFTRGAALLQTLSHPALPTVYGSARDDAGRLLLIRERFDGGTLADRINGGRRLTPAELEGLLRALLVLLDYLHRHQPPILHRDIKPENIMFRSPTSAAPVLVDFDTVAAPEALRSGLTVVGTPGYAAPEQFAGFYAPASDLYGLGVTALFAATHADPAALPRRDGRFDVDHLLSGLPPRVRRVLARLVEPERRDRYASAAEALADLSPPAPPPPRPLPPVVLAMPGPGPGDGPVLRIALGLAGTLLAAVVASVALARSMQPAKPAPKPAPKPPLVCTLESDPPGATVFAIDTDQASAANYLDPHGIHRHLGKTPFRLERSAYGLDKYEPLLLEAAGYEDKIVTQTEVLLEACPGVVQLRRKVIY